MHLPNLIGLIVRRTCGDANFERLSFDSFSVAQDALIVPEVNLGRCDAVQALAKPQMVVVVDKCLDLGFEISVVRPRKHKVTAIARQTSTRGGTKA